MNHCIERNSTIHQKKEMLNKTKEFLLAKINEINKCIEFIDNKQLFYKINDY